MNDLLSELKRAPGRFALATGGEVGRSIVTQIAAAAGVSVASAGVMLTHDDRFPLDPLSLLAGHSCLVDLDILFWPAVRANPVQLLRQLARAQPIIAAWPGHIVGGLATYSEPGRRDHFQTVLADVVVLRPRQRHFPDEIPYEVERIPA